MIATINEGFGPLVYLMESYCYNLRVWSGIQAVIKEVTPQGTVWSCRTAQASLLTSLINRLVVAPAKSQDHRASCGVFAFGADRTPHESKSLDGAAREKTVTNRGHPPLFVPALVEGLAQAYLIGDGPVAGIPMNQPVKRTWSGLSRSINQMESEPQAGSPGEAMSKQRRQDMKQQLIDWSIVIIFGVALGAAVAMNV